MPAQDQTFENGYIYFKDAFRSTTAKESNDLIKSFLKDFPELTDVYVDNFDTQKIVKIEVPAIGREDLLSSIKEDADILSLEVVEAPVWQVEFVDGKTENEVADFLKKFVDVKVQIETKRLIKDYVARIKISDLSLDQSFIDKLQKEYSDVLKIVP
ncbi:MAG: hypothetical protein UT02_C0002G0009 [Parcubacteria group bacterium GW2011_GWC2_38_7]|nr:MAG: hypothetical protein UT02_C0002G0009 [Parcubacteria group bacterium GW2011_GWC2_38_7]